MFSKKFKKKADSLALNREISELVHFLRTPLSSIKTGTQIIKELLPDLVEVYEKSTSLNLIENKISEIKLKKLDCVLNNILNEAERISQYVDKIDQSKI